MIKAVIFDMDGLLIDSEPLWQEAEMVIFKQVNVTLTSQLCLQTQGLRIDEVVDYWYQKYPWNNITKKQVELLIVEQVIQLIMSQGKALPGIAQAISLVKQQQVKIALASSSASLIIEAALTRLGLSEEFEVVYSAESEILGKPHPGVYLTTADKLNVYPQECLALEDSLNGVLAAKSAQMQCVAIPEFAQFTNPKFAIADITLKSLFELDQDVWSTLNT